MEYIHIFLQMHETIFMKRLLQFLMKYIALIIAS